MWLCIYLPSLLLPEDTTAPVVIYDEQNNKIVQLNSVAEQQGIEVNMGLGSACALCADMQILPYCQEQERLKLMQLVFILYRLNGDIYAEKSNTLLIRCDRHSYYYGGQDVLLRVLLNKVKQHHTHFYYATANTPEQAMVLAFAGLNAALQSDQVLPALKRLSTAQLGLDKKTEQQLSRVGIHSVTALFALPMADLATRFSQATIKAIYALKGTHSASRNFFIPPEHFCESVHLPFDIDNHEHLLNWANTLLRLLESYLCSRNQVTYDIDFTFIGNQKENYLLPIKSGSPKYQAKPWLALLTLVLEKTHFTQPIRQIQLSCTKAQLATHHNNDFFSANSSALEAHKLFDTLRTRLGEDAFHPPDSVSFTVCESWPSRFATPTFFAAKPVLLQHHGQVVAGPQRFQTLWWQEAIQRDYFLIETSKHERLWVFRNDQKKWFLHGWFS